MTFDASETTFQNPDTDPHANDAAPYGGGDPYADYREAGDLPFTELVDLADRRLGAGVIAANDEFFAQRENLLLRERAVFDPEHFGHKGKIMDGWETRRRRGADADHPFPAPEDHDWAIVRLGAPGIVRGLIVDTAHFRGNYPQRVSVQATAVDGVPGPEELLADDVKWEEILPPTPVRGHAANAFEITGGCRYTHLRLCQHPDGGIARFRVHGEVVPDPAWIAALGTVDLISVLNGGTYEDASDRFYSSPTQIILPGTSRKMDDGWENRRRRVRDTNDWVRFRLPPRARSARSRSTPPTSRATPPVGSPSRAATAIPASGSRSSRAPASSPTPCTASCSAPRPSSPTSASTPSPTAGWPGCGCTAASRSPAPPN